MRKFSQDWGSMDDQQKQLYINEMKTKKSIAASHFIDYQVKHEIPVEKKFNFAVMMKKKFPERTYESLTEVEKEEIREAQKK